MSNAEVVEGGAFVGCKFVAPSHVGWLEIQKVLSEDSPARVPGASGLIAVVKAQRTLDRSVSL